MTKTMMIAFTACLLAVAGCCTQTKPETDRPKPKEGLDKTAVKTAPAAPEGAKASEGAEPEVAGAPIITELGFGITFPEDWQEKRGVMGTAILGLSPKENANDIFQENVNVVTDDVPDGMSSSEYVKASLDGMSNMLTDFNVVSNVSTEIGGRKAVALTYSHRMGNYRLKVLAYLITAGSKGYVLTCTALDGSFERYKAQFEDVCKSFRVK